MNAAKAEPPSKTMLPGEAELVSEWTGLPGEAKSVKRFERSNGLDTALYKNYLYLLSTCYIVNICPECQSSIHIHYKVTGLQSLEKLYHTRHENMCHENNYNWKNSWSRKLNFWICSFGQLGNTLKKIEQDPKTKCVGISENLLIWCGMTPRYNTYIYIYIYIGPNHKWLLGAQYTSKLQRHYNWPSRTIELDFRTSSRLVVY